jgi:hypothetical protein
MKMKFSSIWDSAGQKRSTSLSAMVLSSVAVAAAVGLQACGSKSDSGGNNSNTISAIALVSDAQLTSGVVNAAHGDAVAAAADQSVSGAMLNFNLADSDDDGSIINRSCSVSADGKSAIVSVSANVSRSRTKVAGGGRVTVSSTRTGKSATTRTWSRADGTPVACNQAGTGASVDFLNADGVRLDVSFERSRSDSTSYAGPRVTRTSSKSFTSSGERSVTWSATGASQSGASYFRNKSVVIKDVNQLLTMTNKNGDTISTSLNINTAEGQPLVVQVERNMTSNAVVSKTFISGEVVTKKDSDSTMTTTYSNLKLNFSDHSCAISSGSAVIVIKDAAGAVLKTLTLGVDSNGDSSLKDEVGEDVEGFALDPCDSEDVKL